MKSSVSRSLWGFLHLWRVALQCTISTLPLCASAQLSGNFLLKMETLGNERRFHTMLAESEGTIARNADNPAAWFAKGVAFQGLLQFDSAIEAYREAIRLKPDAALIWTNLGTAHRAKGQLDEAIRAFDRAAVLENNNPAILLRLWEALDYVGRFDRIHKVRAIIAENDENLLKVGDMLFGMSTLQQSLRLPRKREDAVTPTTEPGAASVPAAQHARQLLGKGIDAFAAGNISDAVSNFETAESALVTSLGRYHTETLLAADYLVLAYVESLRITDALDRFISLRKFDSLIELAQKNSRNKLSQFGADSPLAIRSALALAYFKLLNGDYRNAFEDTFSIRKRAHKVLGENSETSLWIDLLTALCLQSAGQAEEASALALRTYESSKGSVGERAGIVAISLGVAGRALASIDRHTEALAIYDRALPLYHAILGPAHRETLSKEVDRILMLAANRRLDAAKVSYQEIKQRYRSRFNQVDPDERYLDLMYALALFANQQFKEAIQVLTEVIGWANMALGYESDFTKAANSLLALSLAQNLNFGDSLRIIKRLHPALEAGRLKESRNPMAQIQHFKDIAPLYKFYSLAMSMREHTEAFRFSELSKARSLLDSSSLSSARRSTALPVHEKQHFEHLEAQFAELDAIIFEAAEDHAAKLRFELQRVAVGNQLDALQARLEAEYPKFRQLSRMDIFDAESGIHLLDEDAVFISYLTDGTHLGGFALSKANGLLPMGSGDSKDLAGIVARIRAKLEPSAPGEQRPIDSKELDDLAKQLFGPFEQILKNKKKLIISPDGPLSFLPFEILKLHGKLLIEQYEIIYTPSLSVYALAKSRTQEYRTLSRGKILAMGGALYQQSRTGVSRSASSNTETGGLLTLKSFFHNRSPTDESRTQALRAFRANPDAPGSSADALRKIRGEWSDLPGTVKEVEAVSLLFEKSQSRLLLGQDASEHNLIALNASGDLARYQYLLFSTHGYVSPEEPALNSIVLSQIGNPPGVDGYVTAKEWHAYNIKSDLIVLSACDTGSGRYVAGEGIVGLPYALYVAGNASLILTLWPVVDDSTQEFVTSFFKKASVGMGHAEALAKTKREFTRHPRFSHPQYWAPFVLYGS